MTDRNDIMKALGNVMDPELGVDLVTLGMIRDVKMQGDTVSVMVALTAPGCPLKNKIGKDIEEELKKLQGVSKVGVLFGSMTEAERENTFQKAGGKGQTQQTEDPLKKLSGQPIKRIIAVGSGKGGVGKSLVTSLLAVAASRKGFKVGVIDADITGPSIPTIFGQKGLLVAGEKGVEPRKTKKGIEMVSMNLLIPDPTTPVIWRGPVLAGVLRQFYTDVNWGNLDLLFVDLPPGTADVPLTVFQIFPIDGMVVVTSPQELANLVVTKALKMAAEMSIPLVGVVENMTYFVCKDGEKVEVFGKSRVQERCKEQGVPYLGGMPIDPSYARIADEGAIEDAVMPQAVEDTLKTILGEK